MLWLAAAGLLIAGPARSASLVGRSEGSPCRPAIIAAEAEARTPKGLLLAIGQVESGRWDTATGRLEPWPWAVNVAGTGFLLPTEGEAIGLVRAAQAEGVQSIDVGCMQINLQQHPDAFGSLEQAFEPAANARYAAGFLLRLHQQLGAEWLDAGAAYHSQTPEFALPYRARLVAMWPGAGPQDAPAAASVSAVVAMEAADRLPGLRARLADARVDRVALMGKGLLGAPARSALTLGDAAGLPEQGRAGRGRPGGVRAAARGRAVAMIGGTAGLEQGLRAGPP